MVTRCHLCNPEPASWLQYCGCGSSAGAHGILQGTSKLPAKLPLLPEDGENVKCGRGRELGGGIDETEVRFVSHEKEDDGGKCGGCRTCGGGMLLRAASAAAASVKRRSWMRGGAAGRGTEGLAKHGPGLEPRLVHFQPGLDEARPHLRPLHNTPRRIHDACCTLLLKLISAVTWWCCLAAATNGVEAEEEEEEEKLLDEERDDSLPFVHGSLLREKDPVHVHVLAGSGEEIATSASTASVVRPLRAIIGEVGDNEECDQQGHARLLRREDIDYVATTGDGSADIFVLPPELTSADDDGDGEAGGVQIVASEAAGEDAGSDAGDNDEDEGEDEDEDEDEEEEDGDEDGDGRDGGDGDGDGDGDGICEDLGSPGRPIRVGKISPREYQDTINDLPPLYEV